MNRFLESVERSRLAEHEERVALPAKSLLVAPLLCKVCKAPMTRKKPSGPGRNRSTCSLECQRALRRQQYIPKSNRGRKPRFTEELRASIWKMFQEGATLTEACKAHGVSLSGWRGWHWRNKKREAA